jgi:hypothetical protein
MLLNKAHVRLGERARPSSNFLGLPCGSSWRSIVTKVANCSEELLAGSLSFFGVSAFYSAKARSMKELSALELPIASSLMTGAMQAAMIQSMVRNNIITDEEGHEIYEQALLMLEAKQTVTGSADVFGGGS